MGDCGVEPGPAAACRDASGTAGVPAGRTRRRIIIRSQNQTRRGAVVARAAGCGRTVRPSGPQPLDPIAMTTLVAVRKNAEIAIAADSLTTFGDTKLPAESDATPNKK